MRTLTLLAILLVSSAGCRAICDCPSRSYAPPPALAAPLPPVGSAPVPAVTP